MPVGQGPLQISQPSPGSSGGSSVMFSFNTVVKGALGSGRLLDISLAQLALLLPGQWVYVESVRDWWAWRPTDTTTQDTQTILTPTSIGAGAGRFFRRLAADPSWKQQKQWVVRPTTGNFENLGNDDTALLALDSDEELQRRLGVTAGMKPELLPGDYHIYYPEGVGQVSGLNARFFLSAKRSTALGAFTFNTFIYVHGNTPTTAGQGVPFAGPFTISAVTAVNHATNQALQVASAGIAGSWTAAALISAVGSNVAKRCRMTTGANIGGTFWAQEDLGNLLGGNPTAMIDEPSAANVTSGAFAQVTGTFAPAVGEQFVVETLIGLAGALDTDPGILVIFDSVSFNVTYSTGSRAFVEKCQIVFSTAASYQGFFTRIQANGCRWSAGTSTRDEWMPCINLDVTNGCHHGSMDLRVSGQGNWTRGFIHGTSGSVRLSSSLHSNASSSASRTSGWLVNSLGIFNVPNTLGFLIGDQVAFAAACDLWGSGNSFPPVAWLAGSRLTWPAADIVGGAPPASFFFINVVASGGIWGANDMAGGNGNNAVAWDVATSLFTLPRALTPANLQATVAAGGFNGRFFDPTTGCAMIAAQQG